MVRYRRKLVQKNLKNSFPTYSQAQLESLEKRFYHHLSDVIIEIIWSYWASPKDMESHIIYENLDEVEAWIREKKGIFFMLGHTGNWEWTPEAQHRYKTPGIQQYNVYRRLRNARADAFMLRLREKRSGEGSCLEKSNLLRPLLMLKKEGKLFSLGLISDQKPQPQNAYHWTTFMNQDTAFLGGGEVLATKFDWAVGYVHITYLKRGVYSIRVDLITLAPKTLEKGVITETFARKLEANILEQPEQWLWTHNRWKFSRNES